MIKYFICAIVLCYCTSGLFGQQVLSSKAMVAITPAISDGIDLPDNAKKSLAQKLIQITTQNGFGSFSGELVLTANVVTTDKQMTGTVPPQFINNIEVSLYVLNIAEAVIIAETSVSLRGIDKLENRAIIQAINNLNPRSPAIRNFMDECRTKIIDYYTTRIPALLAKSKSLADRAEYDEALAVLSVIPENMDEYPAIADQMVAIYTKKLDKDAASAIQEAKARMATKDYEGALDALTYIDPSSTRFAEASKMINSIKQSIDAKEQAELAAKMQQMELQRETMQRNHDDAVALEKLRIDAAKKVGEAFGQAAAKESMNDKVTKWFLGKFKK